jgi:hypothetical protein
LQWWASKLKREAGVALGQVTPLEFVEVARAEAVAAPRFEVHLANGRWVGVSAGFDPDALARLLAVVEGAR